MPRLLAWLLFFLCACLGAALTYYNWGSVSFHYLVGQAELPLIGLLLSAFLMGIVVALLLMVAKVWGLTRDNRRVRKQLDMAEAELKSLRNLPLSSDKPAPPAPGRGPVR